MNAVVITNWRDNTHPHAGGAEVCCGEVARLLAAGGHEVVYLTAAVEGRPHTEEVDGYRLVRHGGRFTVYLWALWWLLGHRRQVAGVIDSQNGIPFFSPLVLRSRTPVVLLLHHVHQTQFAQYLSRPEATVARWLERSACRMVYRDRLVAAMSPSTRRDARRVLGLRGPIHVVPPGWRLSGPLGRNQDDRSDRPRIVCVGRMVPHKRYDSIISAMPDTLARRPDVELYLVGDGPERPRLEHLVAELGIRAAVHFCGSLPSAARDELVRSAWVTINASTGEGWGLSVVEANALGVPAVAFRVAGLRDSIRHGETGWLIDDGGDLSAGILHALSCVDDPDDAAEWARRTTRWVTSFSWDQTALLLGELLVSESSRLAQSGPERRHLSDLAVKVSVPTGMLPSKSMPRLRRTDRWAIGEQRLTVLLLGCDAAGARRAFARAGIATEGATRTGFCFELARPADHVVVSHPTEPATVVPVPAPSHSGHHGFERRAPRRSASEESR